VCDAKENREKKMIAWNPGGEECSFFLAVFFRITLDGLSKRGTTRISCGHFVLAVFFHVMLDGVSERETIRSLLAQRENLLVLDDWTALFSSPG